MAAELEQAVEQQPAAYEHFVCESDLCQKRASGGGAQRKTALSTLARGEREPFAMGDSLEAS